MSTRSIATRLRLRRPRLDLSMVAIALVALALPNCTLERGGIGFEGFVWNTAATIRTAEGVTIRVTGDDDLFTGGTPHPFAASDTAWGGLTPEERVRADWRRYLLQQLSNPGASPEFRAVFGDGPWCLVEDEARRTDTPTMTFVAPPTTDELTACTGSVVPVSDCPTGAGTMPMLALSAPSISFAPAPAGTTSAEEQILTISNSGTGRLCLARPEIDLSESAHAEYYPVDASDCEPRSMRELELGRALLWTDRPSCQVRIRFAPAAADPGGARLRLSSNDPRAVSFVDITGTPIPGTLAAPAGVCFNVAADAAGCRRNTVAFRNDGPGVVTVRSASVSGATGWTRDPLTLPARVLAGGTLNVGVRACATVNDAALTVASDAVNTLVEVPLLHPASGCTP